MAVRTTLSSTKRAWRPTLVAVAIAPLFAACATVPPDIFQAPRGALVTPAVRANTVSPRGPNSPTPAATASPNPSASSSASPTPTQTPLPSLSAQARADYGDCLTKVVGHWSRGECATLVQKKLTALGFYDAGVKKRIGASAVNAILNYQRSRGLKATGTAGQQTWYALASGRPAVPEVLPEECRTAGVVLCVDQAHRTLRFVKDGTVTKQIPVRLGGFTSHAKTKQWRVFPTANGTWQVYNKRVNPYSETYGYGAMPYSVMFHPDMYVHYSSDFRDRGYSASSHGCVNVGSLDDAKWFYRNTPVGAKVHVY